MKSFLLVFGAAIFVFGAIICQLITFKKIHPNAEMLMRFYRMISSNE
jgi:hypothetical protein